VVVLAAAFTAGCGGSSSSSSRTLEGILKRPGPDVSITAGASEFVPGSILQTVPTDYVILGGVANDVQIHMS